MRKAPRAADQAGGPTLETWLPYVATLPTPCTPSTPTTSHAPRRSSPRRRPGDGEDAPQAETCVSGKDRLVLDLSQLEYISSAGLRVLMLAGKQVKAQGGTLILSGLQPLVAEIFQISRFAMVFTITPSLREALAKASPSALSAFEAA